MVVEGLLDAMTFNGGGLELFFCVGFEGFSDVRRGRCDDGFGRSLVAVWDSFRWGFL